MSDNGDDSMWLASEDILLLRELLLTPKPNSVDALGPRISWAHASPSHSTISNDKTDSETMDEAEDEEALPDEVDGGVVVIALRRQVQLLQQEYDRHLEQRVAKAVVKAGGKTAPRAATIKLYRNYERLVRVAQALLNENQRFMELLEARQRGQESWLQSEQTSQLQQPFRVVSVDDERVASVRGRLE